MSTFLPAEKGQTIRQPSTANLMIDSQDRDQIRFTDSADFYINRNQSIMNGFFTRIALSEHVVEWQYPNINSDLSSNSLVVKVGATNYNIVLLSGFYTVESVLAGIVAAGNALSIPGLTLSVVAPTALVPVATLDGTTAFSIVGSGLASLLFPGLGLSLGEASAALTSFGIVDPDLRPFRYLDFVSEHLTYNQDLKDDSTNLAARTVLTRWYFAADQMPSLDGYGYPILMGYNAFTLRRIFSPPKQIRWGNTQPIGQLEFKVYIDPISNETWKLPGALLIGQEWSAFWDWLATLQVSEC